MLTVINGDCRDKLRELADESVHCVVTSPPYWGLRDYGTASWDGGDPECDHVSGMARQDTERETPGGRGGSFRGGEVQYRDICGKCGARRIDRQLGLESTPEQYVAEMVAIFREVRRVLRSDGTCWVNLGDSYANNPASAVNRNGASGSLNAGRSDFPVRDANIGHRQPMQHGLKPKDLCGIPWMLAFALRTDGWYLRSEIIWHKPNPMPESVTDRPTKAHEQVFLLAKASRYFYDAEAIKEQSIYAGKIVTLGEKSLSRGQANGANIKASGNGNADSVTVTEARNRRSVWTIATAPYSDAHFATFPPKLVEPCVLAGTSARGCCVACGAPWERVVARGDLVPDSPEYKPRGTIRGGDGYVKNAMTPAGETQGHPNHHYEYQTTGWQPTCAHLDADVVPCVVLDPFAGSGTVGKVALELGRRAVLIELNPKYCEMIEKRNQVTLGLPGLA